MIDYEDALLLLQKRYPSVIIILLLVLLCFFVIRREWRFQSRAMAIAALLLCSGLIARTLYVDYLLIALGSEDDMRAEQAFNAVKQKLSDHRLSRLLSEGQKDANQQFYIALIAAQRGLQVSNAKEIRRPGFFRTNSFTSFADRFQYPTTYEEVLQNYQATFGRVQSTGQSNPLSSTK